MSDVGELRAFAPRKSPIICSLTYQIRYRAAWALSRIGPVAIPALEEAVKDKYEMHRVAALDAMGWMSSSAQRVIPILESCLDDEADDVRVQAAKSLARLGPAASQSLHRTLHNSDENVRAIAAGGMAKLEPMSSETRDRLVELTEDPSVDVRSAALLAVATAQ